MQFFGDFLKINQQLPKGGYAKYLRFQNLVVLVSWHILKIAEGDWKVTWLYSESFVLITYFILQWPIRHAIVEDWDLMVCSAFPLEVF